MTDVCKASGSVKVGSGAWLWPNEYEPVAVADSNCNVEHGNRFKVGDRVRVVTRRNAFDDALNDIEVGDMLTLTGVYDDLSDSEWMAWSVDEYPDAWIRSDDIELVDAPLTIRSGKFYKTRDGRKVGPMKEWNCVVGSEYQWESEGYLWKDDGENYDKDSEHTIVAEWTDEPAATSAPKFKVGDRVQYGNIPDDDDPCTITGNDGKYYSIQWDSEDRDGGAYIWRDNELRLVAEATSGKDDVSKLSSVSANLGSYSTTGFTVPLDAPEFAEKEKRFIPDNDALYHAVEMVRTGCCTINEVRNVIGLPPITSGHLLASL